MVTEADLVLRLGRVEEDEVRVHRDAVGFSGVECRKKE